MSEVSYMNIACNKRASAGRVVQKLKGFTLELYLLVAEAAG